jgi:hypothetical protein
MADQEQSHTAKREGEKAPRDTTVGERPGSEGNLPHARVPDESKEHHTEIAVEAGRTGAQRRDNKG